MRARTRAYLTGHAYTTLRRLPTIYIVVISRSYSSLQVAYCSVEHWNNLSFTLSAGSILVFTIAISVDTSAQVARVPVVPIVAAEDKQTITEFFADIPDDLEHLKGVNWEHIDRKDSDYFKLGMQKVEAASRQ